MGFRKGAYATVWEIRQGNGNYAQAKISISRKDRDTEEYRTEFSGWIRLIGDAYSAAGTLGERSRIRIGDCDVTNRYDREKGVMYTNYAVFNFEDANGSRPVFAGADENGFMNVSSNDMDELPFV